MQNICFPHQEVPLALCFNNQCAPTLLCLRCIQDHPKEHNSDAIEIFKVEKDDKWLETHEEQRKNLSIEIKNVFAERETIVTQYKDFLNSSIEEAMKNEGFTKLEKDLQILKDFNFREGDFYQKVNKVKTFYQELPATKDHIGDLRSSLGKLKISDNELTAKKGELVGLIRNFVYGDLSTTKEPSKEEMELNLLKEEFQKFKQNSENRIKDLQKENNNLKAKNKPQPVHVDNSNEDAKNENEAPKKENPNQKKEQALKKENAIQKKEEAPKKEKESPKNETLKKENEASKKDNAKKEEAAKPKVEKVPEARNNENNENEVVSERREIENKQEQKPKAQEKQAKVAQPAQVKEQPKAEKAEKPQALAKVESKKEIRTEADATKLPKESAAV